MRIQPVVASVVGVVDETHWGQVLILPHAYGVVEVTSPNALTTGIGILSTLTNALSRPPTSLDAVSAIARAVANEHVASLILLVPLANVIYLVVAGSGTVYVKRGDTLSVLLAEAGSISGEVKEGDTILLATKGITSILSKEKLSSVFDHLRPQEAAEKLTILTHEQQGVSGGASLIFQVEKIVAVEEETSEPEVLVEESAVAQPTIVSSGKFFSKVRSFRPHHFSRARRVLQNRFAFRRSPSKRMALVAVILIIFVMSVALGITKQSTNSRSRSVVAALSSAQRAYDEGMALLPLNALKGRQRLQAAKAELDPLVKTISPRSKEGKSLALLSQQIADAITQSLAVTHGEPQLFYDVSLLKSGAMASSLSIADGTLAILDAAQHTVYSLDIAAKNGKIVAGGETFTGSTLIANSTTTAYVFTGSGISAVDIQAKTTKDNVVKKDDQWGAIKNLNAFGGNLYLLDSGKNRIWKYIATDSGLSDRREYLNPDTLPDLSKATSMAIDGSVWVGTTDGPTSSSDAGLRGAGKILRFTQGKENTFLPQGVEPAFGSNLVVYASDSTKNVYVLDRDSKRVVVLDKDGMYLAQYVWNGTLNATQLVVSEDAKKILLLADGKIYSIDVK